MSPQRRRVLSRLLAGLAVAAVLVATVTAYAERTLFDSSKFSARAVSVLDDEAFQAQVAGAITDGVLQADPNLVAATPVIQGVSEFIVGLPALQTLLQAGVADIHRAVVEGNKDTVLLTLADIGVVLKGALETAAPKVANAVPNDLDITILDEDDIEGEGLVIDISQIAHNLKILEWIAIVLALAAALGSIALAPTRLAGLRRLGRALTIGAFAAVIAWQLGRGLLAAQFDGDAADTARALYNAFLSDLRTWLLVLVGAGVVMTAGASATREPIDLGARVRHVWEILTRVPEHTPLRVARAAALILGGLLLIANRDSIVEITVIAIGIIVIDVGASELMRMAAGSVRTEQATPSAAAEAEAELGIGPLVRVALVGIVLFAGIVLLGVGTDEEEAPPLEVTACNGSAELCDRPLDEVAFAATHNSMSGATYKNWFFAQHEAEITNQLESGIRALLLDPHYGVRTSGGVATDLERDAVSGEKVEASLGPDGVAAAERIRERIGYEGGGDAEVYLCHAFCEVGAIKAVDGFTEVRDFLIANPGEVVLMSIEDATTPEDTVAAIEDAGLTDFVYRGPNGPDWPTLQEMIDSNQRLLVMAERDGGDPAWYRKQFEITKETPFSFSKPEELEKKASCEPNRGPEDASFFLLNHWIDSSPAPKPTNAKVVNQRGFLLDRIDLCEEVRGMRPNIIAVDFYREGDVVGVVDELNGVGPRD